LREAPGHACIADYLALFARMPEVLAAHGTVNTSLVLSNAVNKAVTVHAAGVFRGG
jgi:hypothetical protein